MKLGPIQHPGCLFFVCFNFGLFGLVPTTYLCTQLEERLIDGTSLVVLLCQHLMMNSSFCFLDSFMVFYGRFWGFDWNPLLQYLPRGAAVSGFHVKLSDFSCLFFCPCFDVL